MKLYIPTSSLNFNDIFATESISPKCFYEQRKFGTKRHYGVNLSLSNEYITLFNKMPCFDLNLGKLSNMVEYPLLIEITIDKPNDIYREIGEGVYIVENTIHLCPQSTRIIFFEQEDYKIILNKALLNLETKLVEKYTKCFHVLTSDELSKLEKFNLDKITVAERAKEDIFHSLQQDQQYNHFKGFYYMDVKYNVVDRYNNSILKKEKLKEIIFHYQESEKMYRQIGSNNLHLDVLNALKREVNDEINKITEVQKDLLNYCELIKINQKQDIYFDVENLKRKIYTLIINQIIQCPKDKIGIVDQLQIEKLFNKIDLALTNYKNKYEEIANDLALVRKRLFDKEYGVDIKKIKSIIIKNLLIFFIKINNPDEIQLFCNTNQIKEYQYVYGFRGAFIGFSGLDKEELSYLRNEENNYLLQKIDNYLQNLKQKIYLNNFKDKKDNRITKNNNIKLEKEVMIRLLIMRNMNNLKKIFKPNEFIEDNSFSIKCTKIENDIEMVIIKFEKNIENDCIYNILFKNKVDCSNLEKNDFKDRLKGLGLKNVPMNQTYAIITYTKTIDSAQVNLDENDLLELIACLEHIINKYKMK